MKIYIHHYYTDKLFFKIGHNTTNKIYNIDNFSDYERIGTITADYKNIKIEFIFNPEINDNEDGLHLIDFWTMKNFYQVILLTYML
jgi:hypothetical protein